MKKHVCTIGFALLLSVFTVYVVLDMFVLGAVYDSNAIGILWKKELTKMTTDLI